MCVKCQLVGYSWIMQHNDTGHKLVAGSAVWCRCNAKGRVIQGQNACEADGVRQGLCFWSTGIIMFAQAKT